MLRLVRARECANTHNLNMRPASATESNQMLRARTRARALIELARAFYGDGDGDLLFAAGERGLLESKRDAARFDERRVTSKRCCLKTGVGDLPVEQNRKYTVLVICIVASARVYSTK